MYARVLIVGDTTLGSASLVLRIRRALEGAGHATCVVPVWETALIGSFARGFAPTVALIEPCPAGARWREELAALGVPAVWIGAPGEPGPSALLRGVRDDAYRSATTSLPRGDEPRSCAVAQCPTEARRSVVEGLASSGDVEVVSIDPAWGAWARDPHVHDPAFTLRRSAVLLVFDGVDAPSPAWLALRAAEGCALVVENSLALRLGDALPGIVAADVSDMASVARRLLDDAAAREEALVGQGTWLDALPSLEDELASALALVNDPGAGLRASRLERPARHVVVYGWFGMDNLGDDLLLRIVADRVRARFPEAVITAIVGNPMRVRELYGFEAVRAEQPVPMSNMLRRADALVLCGGLVFDDPMALTSGDAEPFMEPYINPACQADVCLMAWQHGVPAYYLGAGIGPAEKPATRACLRYIGLSGARLLLRDADSARLALDAGVPAEQVETCCDLVLAARASVVAGAAAGTLPEGLEPGGYVTVALRTWPLNPVGYEEALADELDRIAEESGLTIAFVPFDSEDAHIHDAVASHMRRADCVVKVAARLSMEDMFAVIDGSALAVAMRLHCSILHHVLGKPAVGLDYNEKVGSHFREMGRDRCLVALDDVAGRVSEAALVALEDPTATRVAVERGVACLAPRADAAFEELFAAVEAHEPRLEEPEVFHPRSCSQTVVELHTALARERDLAARADALEDELAAAHRRIEELERSTSYRLGNALVKVPRAILRRD